MFLLCSTDYPDIYEKNEDVCLSLSGKKRVWDRDYCELDAYIFCCLASINFTRVVDQHFAFRTFLPDYSELEFVSTQQRYVTRNRSTSMGWRRWQLSRQPMPKAQNTLDWLDEQPKENDMQGRAAAKLGPRDEGHWGTLSEVGRDISSKYISRLGTNNEEWRVDCPSPQSTNVILSSSPWIGCGVVHAVATPSHE